LRIDDLKFFFDAQRELIEHIGPFCASGIQVFGDRSPVGSQLTQQLVPQVPESTARRVNWTIKIEMYVPATRLTFLKKKVQDRRVAVLLVKTAARVLVLSEATSEIVARGQSGFDPGPRFKLDPDATFTVDVSYALNEVPQSFSVESTEQQE
jgi:hypothetical protein